MKTYFITGGEGFIGHHLAKELLKDKNNRVVTFDALKHFVPLDESNWTFYQDYRTKNLQNDRLIRIRGNMLSRGYLQEVLEQHKPEVIIHLASLPIANISNTHCEEATDDIFLSTVNLLDVIKNLTFKIDRLVHTSSSMVYGDFKRDDKGNILTAKENWECNPKGIYGGMKLSGENMVRAYNQRFGIPFTIIRPSAVYGPTDANKRVTEIFLMNALTGEDLILDNGGEHMVDFTYVDDLIQGFILASESENALGKTFNITRGQGRKIKELSDVIMNLLPESTSKVISKKAKVYRPNRGSLDISRAREILGYNPEHSLEEGMKKYIDFVKKILNEEYRLLK